MSGGFFRGTSADQDTRFSNKQAKLLKTQKFAPELDHLVDMKKVKMDVMTPWIATKVTELLGFEDEVLINYLCGLLEGKVVNGKELQISITGFMEKHTAKFMKELWTLLLSAQKNASGVPQQFLDAKEEETKKKKLEADRIANEIQKKKEKESRELDQERARNMDGAVEMKASSAVPNSKTMLEKDSSSYPKDEEAGESNGLRGRSRLSRSPRPVARSPSAYSDGRKSRSISRSPKAQKGSISPRRRSVTPHKRHPTQRSRSPSRSYFRRRSRSHSPRRSPSPLRSKLRSPVRRRSPLLRRRRSPSPGRHRRSPSPVRRRRSPSPFRRRISPPLPQRRRSPSPMRYRRSPSPTRRRRSPLRFRRSSPSPLHRRSGSPTRRWSPSPTRRRSPSPLRRRYQRCPLTLRRTPSPIGYKSAVPSHIRSPTPSRRKSASPYESSSPSPVRRKNPSPIRRKSPYDGRRSPVRSPREQYRTHKKLSPLSHRSSRSLRSPQLSPKERKGLKSASSSSPERSPTVSESPTHLTRKRSTSEDRRALSPDESHVRQTRMDRDGRMSPSLVPRGQRPWDGPVSSKENTETNRARAERDHKSVLSHERSVHSSPVSKMRDSRVQVRNKERSPRSEGLSGRGVIPETFEQQRSPALCEASLSGDRQLSTYPSESKTSMDRNRSDRINGNGNGNDGSNKTENENAPMEVENVDQNNRSDSFDSGFEESDKRRAKIQEKRKHKKHNLVEADSDGDHSYDSEINKKEAKRRRKEEKKLRKEEKRRRRDERRRRKEERRAVKLKMKNHSDANVADDEHLPRREYYASDDEDTESAHKRLEIELRNKALESIKAKRNSSH